MDGLAAGVDEKEWLDEIISCSLIGVPPAGTHTVTTMIIYSPPAAYWKPFRSIPNSHN